MRAYDDNTTIDGMRRDLRFSRGMLRAAGVHEVELREVQKLVDRGKATSEEIEAASDAIVDANAQVAWGDAQLDGVIGRFAGDVVHLVGGDRDDLRYTSFFREAPGEYIRLALESEIERTAHFQDVAKEVSLPKNAQASLAAVEEKRVEGAKAIKARESAVKNEATVWLRVRRLKEDANAVRRSIYNSLERYAIDHKLPAGYADLFFPSAPTKAKKPKGRGCGRRWRWRWWWRWWRRWRRRGLRAPVDRDVRHPCQGSAS